MTLTLFPAAPSAPDDAPRLLSVCIYCASSDRGPAAHRTAAATLGAALAARGVRLIYGGGRVGLMGVAADAALAVGGEVIGIIPELLMAREVGHRGLTRLEIVPDMHTRKRRMVELADAFLVLPGGLGTLDELFEVLTWAMLGLHDRPIVICDLDGYWQPLASLIEGIIAAGYARPGVRALYQIVPDVPAALALLDGLPALDTAVATERL